MLEKNPVRSAQAVQDAIHCKPAGERLTPVESAIHSLEQLFGSLFKFSLHRWHQRYPEGPHVIAAIAEAAREADPLIADLLRWTAQWVTTRGVAMASVVPELWAVHEPAARRFLLDVAARWPEALDPDSLSAPLQFQRPVLVGQLAVGFTPAGAACAVQCAVDAQSREGVFRTVLGALWNAGAADQVIEDLYGAYFKPGADEVEVVCRFISFDGDGGDAARKGSLRRLVHPVSTLAQWLGVGAVPLPALIRVKRLEELEGLLDDWRTVRCEGPVLDSSLRMALRADPDALVVDATLLQPGDEKLLLNALFTGHMVIAAGASAVLDELVKAMHPVPLFDRR